MIEYIDGDILTPNQSDSKVLVCHQVNCQGVMGSGLAKQVKKECPQAFRVYADHVKSLDKKCLGDVVTAVIPSKNFTIANIFGQYDYGWGTQQTNYMAIDNALAYIGVNFSDYIIRIPYLMGCVRGGGNWEMILAMINGKLSVPGMTVQIWKLDRG